MNTGNSIRNISDTATFKEFLKEDGVRDTDIEYQEKIAIHMKNTIHVIKNGHPDLEVVELESIGIDERVQEIKDYLEETGKIEMEEKKVTLEKIGE